MKASLIWYSFILAVIFFVVTVILCKLPLHGNVFWVVTLLAAIVFAFVTYFVLIGMTKCNEGFHFKVSEPRRIGMCEGVSKLPQPPYYNPTLNYPLEGSGITCAKPYVGYEGAFEMNVGDWKTYTRPDTYAGPGLNTPLCKTDHNFQIQIS